LVFETVFSLEISISSDETSIRALVDFFADFLVFLEFFWVFVWVFLLAWFPSWFSSIVCLIKSISDWLLSVVFELFKFIFGVFVFTGEENENAALVLPILIISPLSSKFWANAPLERVAEK
jgi:hypothetical protein